MTPVFTAQVAHDVARVFVHSRLNGAALAAFPGEAPTTVRAAYAIQDEAITLWPDRLCGWKVGRIGPPWLEAFGADRLVGPIFANGIRASWADDLVEFPVFTGGFAAVEAEFIVRLADDAPVNKVEWTVSEARALVEAVHVGIESAGSPLATINDFGPAVIISDFGNNAGLIVGPEIHGWRGSHLELVTTQTFVEGVSVGRGAWNSIPGGPFAALAFALGCCARRGLPLKAGHLISTGATTGVHPIRAGQCAKVVFSGVGEVRCRAVATVEQEQLV